ncbi:UDP-glycosyltransferase 87A1 [Quercus suber]|uniref:UDP-glycosyltransferase 87A1 n=1 Tax=Quercus suber TaxID=58331 RepID=UPI0032DE6F80
MVAIPFPCQSHINAMMGVCKSFSSKQGRGILITFVVTEEWHSCICGSDPSKLNDNSNTIRFATIPNVFEREKVGDFGPFNEVVKAKMEAPVEELLDRLDPPVDRIIADFELQWPLDFAIRKEIPIASFWSMSASFFSMLHRYYVFTQHHHLPLHFIDQEDKHVENIPGISSTHLEDLRILFHVNNPKGMEQLMNCFSMVSKTQYLLVNSFNELEAQAFDSLKATFPFPVYPIGPTNRCLELKLDQHSSFTTTSTIDYLKWLDSQPRGSVLYVSFGSFFELSSTQMDEFAVALCNSGVRFLWVTRGEASRLKETCGGDKGLVVPWCDQLRVLCHPSVGGFWSHSGWNSVQETIYAGIPMLAFPLFLDQVPNSRKIEEDWKIGWRVKRAEIGSEILVATEDILQHIQRFMDLESCEGKETRKRARELKNMCDQAIAKGGSFDSYLDAFVSDFLEGNLNH